MSSVGEENNGIAQVMSSDVSSSNQTNQEMDNQKATSTINVPKTPVSLLQVRE